MEKEFVSYNQALRLKELGFDEPCFAYYNKKQLFSFTQVCNEPIKGYYIKMSNRLCTPTFSQAFRWFREKGYDVKVQKEYAGLYFGFYFTGVAWIIIGNGSYEEAESACLDKLLEIVQ